EQGFRQTFNKSFHFSSLLANPQAGLQVTYEHVDCLNSPSAGKALIFIRILARRDTRSASNCRRKFDIFGRTVEPLRHAIGWRFLPILGRTVIPKAAT